MANFTLAYRNIPNTVPTIIIPPTSSKQELLRMNALGESREILCENEFSRGLTIANSSIQNLFQ